MRNVAKEPTILVVDDDEPIQDVLVKALAEGGFVSNVA
jgi:CheY-like chemotaxis protein